MIIAVTLHVALSFKHKKTVKQSSTRTMIQLWSIRSHMLVGNGISQKCWQIVPTPIHAPWVYVACI